MRIRKLLTTSNHTKQTLGENSTTIDTVADSAATGHFFPNENNDKNIHNQIEVVQDVQTLKK